MLLSPLLFLPRALDFDLALCVYFDSFTYNCRGFAVLICSHFLNFVLEV